MPADFELKPSTRTVYSRGWGALTDADLLDHLIRLAGCMRDGSITPEWAQIYDFTGVEHLRGVTSAGVRKLADWNPWPAGCVRVAIVADDEQFGLVRMYQMIDPKADTLGITRSAEEAEAWVARERARLGADR